MRSHTNAPGYGGPCAGISSKSERPGTRRLAPLRTSASAHLPQQMRHVREGQVSLCPAPGIGSVVPN